MAPRTKSPAKGTNKGKGTPSPKAGGKLNRKVGPLPLKYWLVIAAVFLLVLYFYFKRKGATAEAAGTNDLSTYSATVSPQQAASAGTPSANSPVSSQLDPETLAALIGSITESQGSYVTPSDLQGQLDSLGSNVAAQIAAATFTPPSSTMATATANQPNASTPAATKTATGAPVKKTTATGTSVGQNVRYYTYAPGKAPAGRKGDEISLKAGQVLRFAAGKGYYAV